MIRYVLSTEYDNYVLSVADEQPHIISGKELKLQWKNKIFFTNYN